MTENPDRVQPVDVRNFNMSFGRMVVFMVKWAIATIPAMLILIMVGYVAFKILFDAPRLPRPIGTASFSSPPPISDEDFEAEMAHVRELLSAGRAWEAYGIARRLEERATGAQKAAAEKLREEARKKTQMTEH